MLLFRGQFAMEADADDTQIVVRGAAIVGGVSIGITLGCTLLPGYGIDGGLGVVQQPGHISAFKESLGLRTAGGVGFGVGTGF